MYYKCKGIVRGNVLFFSWEIWNVRLFVIFLLLNRLFFFNFLVYIYSNYFMDKVNNILIWDKCRYN